MADYANKQGLIFISYRREDSAGIAGRIYDRLIQEFGRNAVFKDVDSIPLGTNFKQHIDSVIQRCDVVIAIIGDNWSGIDKETNKSRLAEPRDFVRLELEAALKRNIPVIPLLVNNAYMPSEESLPPSLIELTSRNGMPIGHDPRFHPDVDHLIKKLKQLFDAQSGMAQPPQITNLRGAASATEEAQAAHSPLGARTSRPNPVVSNQTGIFKPLLWILWIVGGTSVGATLAYIGCIIYQPSSSVGYTAIAISGLLGAGVAVMLQRRR